MTPNLGAESVFADFGRLTALPRVVRIGALDHPADAMTDAIEKGWSARFCGVDTATIGYALYRLPLNWYVRRTVSGLPTVVDDEGRTRAALIEGRSVSTPKLVLFERFHISIQAGEDDAVRIATTDRSTGDRMRVSPWFRSDDIASLTRVAREHGEWLFEIRPDHANPFSYW
ncbi:hypothetical protein [Burkholderia glumae]|uniref:hypothetical protein n=1 Tax=Burkholderia glumae TaxID=337 RepID=UPI00039AA188|nr:hypothetical protein [Burkholderia glumae]